MAMGKGALYQTCSLQPVVLCYVGLAFGLFIHYQGNNDNYSPW